MFNTPADRIEAILEFTTGQLCIPELYDFAKQVLRERYAGYFYEYFGMNTDVHEDDMNAFQVARDCEQNDALWSRIFGAYDDEVYDLFYEVKRAFANNNPALTR